jgi:hypothetical protein
MLQRATKGLKMNDRIIIRQNTRFGSVLLDALSAISLFLAALSIAYLIYLINQIFSLQPEKAVMSVGIILVMFLGLPLSGYLILRRGVVDPWKLALMSVTIIVVLLISIYFFWVSFSIFFPADILIWSESDFVNDVLKFRVVGWQAVIYLCLQNDTGWLHHPISNCGLSLLP